MGYGYSLLPTKEQPTSNLTLRLTPSEKRERDSWICEAYKRDWKVADIAFEVGLSVQRVRQILDKGAPQTRPAVIHPKNKQTASGIGCGYIQYKPCSYCGAIVETLCYDSDCSGAREKYGVGCLSLANHYCSSSCWSNELIMR